MLNQVNTKKQGDVGLAAAAFYFSKKGYTVCFPMTDSQDYDLVVDDGTSLKRVQVKTTSYQRNGNYQVSLTVKGGNRTTVGSIVKKFDSSKVDLVFVFTELGDMYVIPTQGLGDNISLYSKYDQYKVS